MTASTNSQSRELLVDEVTKTFGVSRALDRVSLSVKPGEVHALVGHNGSGKSTLVRILSGYHAADPGGSVTVDGKSIDRMWRAEDQGVRFVHQNLGLVHDMSIADNLALTWGYSVSKLGKISARSERKRAIEALASVGYELDVRRKVGDLSASERVGVALARALAAPGKGASYVVLDEPTAAMPRSEVDNLFAAISHVQQQGTGILFVSHHIQEVLAIGDRVTVLRDGRVAGRFDRASVNKRELVELIGGSDGEDEETPRQVARVPLEFAGGLTISGLSGETVANLSAEISPGEIFGIAGLNGSGRDALLGLVYGSQPRTSGSVTAAGREVPPSNPWQAMQAGVCLVPADRLTQAAFMDLTIRENIYAGPAEDQQMRILHRNERREVKKWIKRLDINPRETEVPMWTASGGNQQKMVIARSLRRKPPVLMLDEPTQGVDVGAIQQIHSIIREVAADGVSVLIASSSEEELVDLCHRVIVMADGQVVDELAGEDLTVSRLLSAILRDRHPPTFKPGKVEEGAGNVQ